MNENKYKKALMKVHMARQLFVVKTGFISVNIDTFQPQPLA